MWFSKQGTKLAYATFNETKVPSVYLSQYGVPDTMYDQYSKILGLHYPKVSRSNFQTFQTGVIFFQQI